MKKEKKKKSIGREILEWIVAILAALVVVYLIRTFLFTMIRVDGESMLDTLHDGDRIASTIVDLKASGVERTQIVICTYPGYESDNFLIPPEYCIKRVIGLPGETLEIKGGVTYIDGEALVEPYVTRPLMQNYGPITLGDDKYFVMGDNRANSHDSRSRDVGPLPFERLNAIARLRIWPLDRIGTVS